ncbi:hypothetical protein AVEN_26561-1 [Araneus ventricosus]|uniref:Uncharacterized protein n=1 Tax=Araneus ventricosus TaxID=182803 RepID=A0A4Y2FVL1_ARAVE|nr:hypothetical protein AVEN_26561-1 [Araneus ventricosus]
MSEKSQTYPTLVCFSVHPSSQQQNTLSTRVTLCRQTATVSWATALSIARKPLHQGHAGKRGEREHRRRWWYVVVGVGLAEEADDFRKVSSAPIN